MRFVYFGHSIVSCWNNGKVHFQRGLLRALIQRGHEAIAFEPAHGGSRANLIENQGIEALEIFDRQFPELTSRTYGADIDLDSMLDGADVVIVHEWTDAEIVAAIGRRRRRADFLLFFHDTHHRLVSDPAAMPALAFEDYDAVLAFGESLADLYRRLGWGRHCFVWHEAADTDLFHPVGGDQARHGLVWIGNWGGDERRAEMIEFLYQPAREAKLDLTVYGVQYPAEIRAMMSGRIAHYGGWLPNTQVPDVFARHRATVHVPRRAYRDRLPGIPGIRMFEALACGIPLVTAPWEDQENLFRAGEDYLVAADHEDMARHLRALDNDPALRAAMAESGLAQIRERHSCAHRADELLAIVKALKG